MHNETNIRIIPPLIPLATMTAGYALHLVWPVAILNSGSATWIGWTIVMLSFFPVVFALRALRAAGTTADVRKRATRLVTGGVFRYTRNPMYLAMMLLCIGLALIVNSLSMLLFVVPTGSVLCLAVIRKEESFLLTEFGETYANYMASVRRWA